jgi:tRNA-dihydrouridine synthase A
LLYSEMVTTGAILHGNRRHHLEFNPEEHPVALQLGGSNPRELAICTKMAEDYGYNEVNLNIGCPSDRVQNGRFGACLMAEPDLVAECIAAMSQAASIPITIKSRIGIDAQDSYQDLVHFVSTVSHAGCKTFIVHARKAWLSGLSPKQNRDIPPLRYDVVYQIKQDFPHLEIILNGGITTLNQAEQTLQYVDGVMVGREAYHNPYLLAEVDRRFFGKDKEPRSREMIVHSLIPYIEQQLKNGLRLNCISRHILGLFHSEPGARAWRRHLSDNACKTGADIKVIMDALQALKQSYNQTALALPII